MEYFLIYRRLFTELILLCSSSVIVDLLDSVRKIILAEISLILAPLFRGCEVVDKTDIRILV